MLSENMRALHDSVLRGEHRALRIPLDGAERESIAREIQDAALPLENRAARRLKLFLEHARVGGLAGSAFVCLRTLPDFPDIYAPGERERLTQGRYVHEQGRVCNIACDYAGVIAGGLLPRRDALMALGDSAYVRAAVECIDAVIAFADRHAALLCARGEAERAQALESSIRTGATGFWAALQTFRVLHFALWASNVYHNTVGRFDQYMLPYYRADIASGRLTPAQADELLCDFFLSFNLDSDMYTGMQQGDNGQSMVLGGCDAEGGPAYNELSEACLRASLDMRLIDPKLNLRVDARTPIEVYELCTQLTRQGLGFPQYSNDDVVIPALIDMGYAPEDARNYVVAACWEFIIPGVAMDIPNIGAVSLAAAADRAIRMSLGECASFEELFASFRRELFSRAQDLSASLSPLYMEPAPYASVLMSDITHDVSQGARYNNYGIHGTGCAACVDQLAAVRQLVFEEGRVSRERLLRGLSEGFDGDGELLSLLRRDAPKLGRDEAAGELCGRVLSAFADSWQGLTNERGGLFRPGTGSAMYYLWHADELGFTADGRMPGEPLSANFSPSLLLRDAGPLSVVEAFAQPAVRRCMNGGPLTLELHDSVFRREEGLCKVAQLVRTFILLGGHQLQLNSVNADQLRDAQAHPENYANLIVRVWGWSGHFVLLDRAYQEQIIARTSYLMN